MNRVDVLGAPGIGKTFLLSVLRARLPPGHYVDHEAVLIAAKAMARALGRGCSALLKAPIPSRLRFAVGRAVFTRVAHAAYIDCPTVHDAFFRTVLDIAGSAGKPAVLKVQAVARVHTAMRDLTAFQTFLPPEAVVLIDEPLSKKIYSFIDGQEPDFVTVVERYFKHMPAPDLLIYAHCNPATTLERVVARKATVGKEVYLHRSRSPRELAYIVKRLHAVSEIGAGVLGRRGVPILKINTAGDLNRNMSTILSGLGRLRRGNLHIASTGRGGFDGVSNGHSGKQKIED